MPSASLMFFFPSDVDFVVVVLLSVTSILVFSNPCFFQSLIKTPGSGWRAKQKDFGVMGYNAIAVSFLIHACDSAVVCCEPLLT